MRARIPAGFTRHVGIGDNITVPEIEVKYIPLRGPAINEMIMSVARAEDPLEIMCEQMASQISWWEAEGYDSDSPTAEELGELDAFAFRDLHDVIINGMKPARIFDRPEQENEPLPIVQQEDKDMGNSPAG